MLNPTSTLAITLFVLPAIFAQATSNDNSNTTATSAPANTSTPAVSNPTFTPTNFTPTLATSTTCGTSQQNFNQCITKVGKDISSCTNNVCLCQTYANIATCYNGCPELASQGEAYQSQSAQYCSIAGVKPNTTATVTPATSNKNTTTTNTPTSTPITSSTSSNSSSNANTFSAAKGSASSATVSLFGALAALSAAAFTLVV